MTASRSRHFASLAEDRQRHVRALLAELPDRVEILEANRRHDERDLLTADAVATALVIGGPLAVSVLVEASG